MGDVLRSTIEQLSIVLCLALIFYFGSGRKKKGFFPWLGLYFPKNKEWIGNSILVLAVSTLVMAGPLLLFQYFGYNISAMFYDEAISGRGLGISIVVIILLKALIQTALSEELFFRGLIGKEIAGKFGYLAGNITQAVIFGLPHGLPLMVVYKEYFFGITLILTAGIVGYFQFWLNEKKADGSLLPSIIIHSIVNIVSFITKALG